MINKTKNHLRPGLMHVFVIFSVTLLTLILFQIIAKIEEKYDQP